MGKFSLLNSPQPKYNMICKYLIIHNIFINVKCQVILGWFFIYIALFHHLHDQVYGDDIKQKTN